MNVDYLLIDDSVHCPDIPFNELKQRLQEFIRICDEIITRDTEETIKYSIGIFDKTVGELSFADWLYQEEDEAYSDEKQLLRLILEKDFTFIENSEVILHSLQTYAYPPDNIAALHMIIPLESIPTNLSVFKVEDCFAMRKYYLKRATDRLEFCKGIKKTFPNVHFGTKLEHTIKQYNPISDHVDEIIRHLSALNDYGQVVYEESHRQGENEVLTRLASMTGIICSPEGNAEKVREYLVFQFEARDGSTHNIRCSPHTKLYRADSNYRIYFTWNVNLIQGLPFILVGHIGGHPY